MLQYDVLNIIEFSSLRKRMTVIVKDQRTGQIKVLVKGADSVINSLLAKLDADDIKDAKQSQIRQSTAHCLLENAKQGLRTLLIAEKTISQNEYNEWN